MRGYRSDDEGLAEKVGGFISGLFTTIIFMLPLQALGVWAFWNWIAWNFLNAPRMSYWIACAAVLALGWFFGLFKRGS